ncbi:hypothetical protein KUV51_02235 [Tateyamaria omphalii]|uniref:hypothetical protein n=1 Tax=Tateyamaria omphalii TaxID=299262 RepID=UPI001C99AEC5|nr:hypothetical protein [Tateyamaria omphalii]MBY5931805.1 hypothetical protein [Tateyamaria omphalii]
MSWTEVQNLGVKAANGAGVPPAQALAFGAMLARHVADDGPQGIVATALSEPERIVGLAHRVETIVEAASISAKPVHAKEEDAGTRAMLVSWIAGLPCKSELEVTGAKLRINLSLTEPSARGRPDRLHLDPSLAALMTELAAKTYVPDSDMSRSGGAGAGLMELD